MRHDRRPRHAPETVQTPLGIFCEMEVWLSDAEIAALTHGQLQPSARVLFEPWIRLRLREHFDREDRRHLVPEELDAGIEVMEQDDGA